MHLLECNPAKSSLQYTAAPDVGRSNVKADVFA